MMTEIAKLMSEMGLQARKAAAELAYATAERKHAALISAAEYVWKARNEIIQANEKDLAYGSDKGLSPAMMDRLKLDEDRIRGIVDGLRTVAEQPDPLHVHARRRIEPDLRQLIVFQQLVHLRQRLVGDVLVEGHAAPQGASAEHWQTMWEEKTPLFSRISRRSSGRASTAMSV